MPPTSENSSSSTAPGNAPGNAKAAGSVSGGAGKKTLLNQKPAFVELSVGLINEGKLLEQANRQLRAAFRELRNFEDETGEAGKATVTVAVEIKKAKDLKEHYMVSYTVRKSTPTSKVGSVVKEKGGRLLCRPEGSASDTPDQGLLFNERGDAIAGTDPDTGESFDPPEAPTEVKAASADAGTPGAGHDSEPPQIAGRVGTG